MQMKTSLVVSALLVMSVLILVTASATAEPSPAQDGDIVFQQSNSNQSEAIKRATDSRYTHVGVVFVERGIPYVYEANGPVNRTPLKKWIARGLPRKRPHHVRKRLRDRSGLDYARLRSAVGKFMGKRYDRAFNWSDNKIYCSELVWKAYHRAFDIEVGDLKQVRDFNLKDPLVKKDLKKRYKGKIPYDMTVISPADMFRSDLLITVAQD